MGNTKTYFLKVFMPYILHDGVLLQLGSDCCIVMISIETSLVFSKTLYYYDLEIAV